MGGGTETTTQTSGLSNPAMEAAATTIGNQLNTQLQSGVKPFTGTLAPDLSNLTMSGVNALGGNQNNPAYTQGISSAIGQQADIATGANMADDPYRRRLIDDISTNVNATLQGSGRFGSGTQQEALVEEVAGALAPYDYQRQQTAIQNLPSLYQAGLMPAGAQLQAGQVLDAQALAKATDAERLFDVTNNQGWNTLQRGTAIFSGTAPISGTTQSTITPTAPWWQQALGYVAGNAGRAVGSM